MNNENELCDVVNRLQSKHDVLPFMTVLHPADTMKLSAMPEAMQLLLESAPDYRPIEPGSEPVWLQIASGNEAAELVVYRARTGSGLYIMAPHSGA